MTAQRLAEASIVCLECSAWIDAERATAAAIQAILDGWAIEQRNVDGHWSHHWLCGAHRASKQRWSALAWARTGAISLHFLTLCEQRVENVTTTCHVGGTITAYMYGGSRAECLNASHLSGGAERDALYRRLSTLCAGRA